MYPLCNNLSNIHRVVDEDGHLLVVRRHGEGECMVLKLPLQPRGWVVRCMWCLGNEDSGIGVHEEVWRQRQI